MHCRDSLPNTDLHMFVGNRQGDHAYRPWALPETASGPSTSCAAQALHAKPLPGRAGRAAPHLPPPRGTSPVAWPTPPRKRPAAPQGSPCPAPPSACACNAPSVSGARTLGGGRRCQAALAGTLRQGCGGRAQARRLPLFLPRLARRRLCRGSQVGHGHKCPARRVAVWLDFVNAVSNVRLAFPGKG